MSSQNHNFVRNQIQECLKSCSEVWEEARANNMKSTTNEMKTVYSQLVDLQQDFEIYTDVLQENPPEVPYESVIQEYERIKFLKSRELKSQKEQLMKSVGKEIRDDEDVELDDSESSAGLICPITSALPEHPVVSKICHHVYDKDAIVKYIRQQNQQGKRHVICPAIGCNQKISLSEIAEDPEVTRKVEKARKARDRNWEQME